MVTGNRFLCNRRSDLESMMDKLAHLSFEELVQQVRACNLCADFLPLGPRLVVQLSPESRILVVGQAAGRRVHETGVLYNDLSGDRLRKWMGITREEFYDGRNVSILHMGFCYLCSGEY